VEEGAVRVFVRGGQEHGMSLEGVKNRKRELSLLLRRASNFRMAMAMRRNVRCRLCGRRMFVSEVPFEDVLGGFDGGLCACDVAFEPGDFMFVDNGVMAVAQEREV